jgi:hypothetical protein
MRVIGLFLETSLNMSHVSLRVFVQQMYIKAFANCSVICYLFALTVTKGNDKVLPKLSQRPQH